MYHYFARPFVINAGETINIDLSDIDLSNVYFHV
jgi:hypothetical protein